ncbi:hypothetical protein, partial [Mucilaginibacter psychrotolerans]|uniref:hypothetical protein n=1 Tax=Mucilaginibacter psychrotolerans TaxID=1524096 RepID=UPI00195D3421
LQLIRSINETAMKVHQFITIGFTPITANQPSLPSTLVDGIQWNGNEGELLFTILDLSLSPQTQLHCNLSVP